jgi:signal transduction histidine kinase
MRAPNVRASMILRLQPVGGALSAVVLALAAATAASVLVPGFHLRFTSLASELVVDTVGVAVTVVVAMLSWARFREDRQPIALFQSAAFLVLAIGNAARLLLLIAGLHIVVGRGLQDPGQAPLSIFIAAHLAAAGLLVLGGSVSPAATWFGRGIVVVGGSAVAMAIVAIALGVGSDRLPPFVIVERAGPGLAGLERSMASLTPLGVALEFMAGGMFLLGAFLSLRLRNNDGSNANVYRALGLVFAAFSQTFGAGETIGVITGGDVLRIAFGVTVLVSVQAQTRAALFRLRGANDTLTRLSRVQVDRGALEERARLTRAHHDGLAQELWVAKLKTGRLAALPELGHEARALSAEIEHAVDAGLADAQQAVAALRLSGSATGTLSELLARTVTEFGDRFGLRVEFEWDAGVAQLPPRVQAEALRVVQEALTNVRRHADATVARVHARIDHGDLVLVVADNGKGFDLDTVGTSAYGLASMRERAALIGGQLRIDSRPRDGTRLSLVVPLKLHGALAAAPTL